MVAGGMTLAKGGVRVDLNAEETARLREMMAERDVALAAYSRAWELLYTDACERAGIVRDEATKEGEQKENV